MGAGQSNHQAVSEGYLTKLSSSTSVPYADDFWTELLADCFHEPLISLDPKVVEEKLRPHCLQLLICNPMSHNFQALVLHTVSLLGDENIRDLRGRRGAANAVRMVTAVVKVAGETGNGSSLLDSLFEVTPNLPIPQELLAPGDHVLLRLLVRRCLLAMLHQPARGSGYVLIMEILHLVMILMAATQLGSQHIRGPPGTHPGVEALLSMVPTAPQVVSMLLSLYISRPLPPEDVMDLSQPRGAPQGGDGTLSSVAAAASALMWLPAAALGSVIGAVIGPGTDSQGEEGPAVPPTGGLSRGYPLSPSPLADLALMTLLLLVQAPDQPPAFNPYIRALRGLQDAPDGKKAAGDAHTAHQINADMAPDTGEAQGTADVLQSSASGSLGQQQVTVSFSDLVEVIARALSAPALVGQAPGGAAAAVDADPPTPPAAWRLGAAPLSSGADEAMVLLYVLLTGNVEFRAYVQAQPDMTRFLLSLLRALYMCEPSRQPHMMFMAQTLLLVLSQDSQWAARIHHIPLPHGVAWCKEHMAKGATLGSLVLVVLLRTISTCWSLSASSELTTPANALAALANLAPYSAQLHARAAQRLLALLASLTKKYVRLGGVLGGPLPLSAALAGRAEQESSAELTVVEDWLRILLEILNLCITGPTTDMGGGGTPGSEAVVRSGQLAGNIELVYALLHQQDCIASLQTHPSLGPLASNLHAVIDFFTYHLDQAARAPTAAKPIAAADATLPVTDPAAKQQQPQQQAAPGDQPSNSWYSAQQVLQILTKALFAWRHDRIRSFPQLRFVFREEEEPDAFFVPLVWRLVLQRCGSLAWDPQHLLSLANQAHNAAAETELGLQ